MNILFLTLANIVDIEEHGIYQDLMREFKRNHHRVFVVSPSERKYHQKTRILGDNKCKILRVSIGNIQKTKFIEKGISTILLESQFKKAIKKYFTDIKFDLIIYSTPPVTFAKIIKYIKKRDKAISYLLLKDIFPQNAVDMQLFSKKSLIYKIFREKEKKLYRISDRIGCMSQANVDYTIAHNTYIDKKNIHILPNSIEILEKEKDDNRIVALRNKHKIPLDKKVFVYGGNLGKPQDIPFVIECLKDNENKEDRFFVICGTGTEYWKIKKYLDERRPNNILLINGLPKEEYEDFIASCDVGLIFLDYRFTIPNFPSRLLSYMQNEMPIIACTDTSTDIGRIIESERFGWWCESKNVINFTKTVDLACEKDWKEKGINAKKYLMDNYTVEKSYRKMMEQIIQQSV
ncbi:MAG: glycosyltransferase family 4 protein [Clostridia bacterium]